MALQYHPDLGTIVICDFSGIRPEMVKRRPAIIISPRFRTRNGLCTVVPLSTTEPSLIMPYHYRLTVAPSLPAPYDSPFHWVKCDMLATVSFRRLNLPFNGRDATGKRQYDTRVIGTDDLNQIRKCILHAIDLSFLTAHL